MLNELFDGCLKLDSKNVTIGSKDIFNPLPTHKGVILFTDTHDLPIQLLITANIRRTARARLLPDEFETRTKRANISPITGNIYYCCCYNDFGSFLKYFAVAKALYPDSYRKIVKLPRPVFVRISLSESWPYFSLTEKPLFMEGDKIFGPFPTRRSANSFVQILHDIFSLCQRPDLITGSADIATCPYYQMSSCPAPCMGRSSTEDYLMRVNDAVSVAVGQVDAQVNKLTVLMKQQASEMKFELADHAKKNLEMLSRLNKDTYRWTTDISKLNILHIDRSAKIKRKGIRKKVQTYSAFVIRADQIEQLPDFAIDDLSAFYAALEKQLAISTESNIPDIKPNISILSWFLFRSKPAGIWLDCSCTKNTAIPSKQDICKAMTEKWPVQNKDEVS